MCTQGGGTRNGVRGWIVRELDECLDSLQLYLMISRGEWAHLGVILHTDSPCPLAHLSGATFYTFPPAAISSAIAFNEKGTKKKNISFLVDVKGQCGHAVFFTA